MNAMDNIEEVLPLSPAQAGMLFESVSGTPRAGTYVAAVTVTLQGQIDASRLNEALQATVQKSDALRACFVHEGLSQPVQLIRKSAPPKLEILDWSTLPDTQQAIDLAAFITDQRKTGFDLKSAPLMRVHLIQMAPDHHKLIWTAHHLIADGWSAGVFIGAILDRYNKAAPAQTEPASFRSYLAWLKSRDTAPDRAFWTDYLRGIDAPTSITNTPPDPPAQQGLTPRLTASLDPDTTKALGAAARTHRITTGTYLNTIWALTLRRYSGRDDVIFGQTNAGRPTHIKGIQTAIGAFINTLPVRLTIDPDQSFSALLTHAEQDAVARRSHEHSSLADVLDCADLPRGTQAFDTLFVFEDLPAQTAATTGLKAVDIKAEDASPYPLAILVYPADPWRIEALYDPGKLTAPLVQSILDDFQALLSAALRTPDQTVQDLTKTAWGLPQPTGKETAPDATILNDILKWADETPTKTALSFEGTTLSYADLSRATTDLAATLQAKGIGKGDIVPIALNRSASVVIAMLAVWRTGAAYTPLDLTYPKARLSQILGACTPKCVITSIADQQKIDTQNATPVLIDAQTTSHTFEPVDIAPEDPAYIIFTSGSSGTPKGVVISHANLAYSTNARKSTYADAPDAFLLMSSFAFDSSVVGLYWTLANGGKLVISKPRAEQDLHSLGTLISAEKISHILCLPSLYQAMLTTIPRSHLSSLKTAIVAGEAVTAAVLTTHQKTLPKARLFNEYGPTEATVWCAASELTRANPTQTLPIGTPPAGTTLTITDPDGHPLPTGMIGEIRTAGPGTAQGYLNDPAATNAAFTANSYRTGDLGMMRDDGQAIFLGRIDDQIKIRGHRIEPSDVEANIGAATGHTRLAVIAKDQKLICFVAADPSQFDAAKTLTTLKAHMPAHMVPAAIRALPNLPKLPNGKTDLNALKSLPDADAPKIVPHQTPATFAEIQLADIWKDVLKLTSISREDNFFDLGGDSLSTISVALKAEEKGLNLMAHELFEYPILADMADRLHARAEALSGTIPQANLAHANDDGDKNIFFMIHGSLKMYSYLSSTFGKNRPLGFLFSHYVGGDIYAATRVEDLADEAYTHLKSLKPDGPYQIGGYSLGGVIALELADRLTKEGDAVELLFMLDPSYDVGQPAQTRPRSQIRRGKLQQNLVAHAGMGIARLKRRVTSDANNEAKFAYIRRVYARILTYYRPPQYDGKAVVMMTANNNALHKQSGWLDAALTDYARHDLEFDHLDLQKDPDALMAWTSKLASVLAENDAS